MFTDILVGHFNEIMEREDELHDTRMAICIKCPLMADSKIGKVCSNKRYYNKKTGKVTFFPCNDCQNGCGCRLEAKTRVEDSKCPLDKW